MAIVRKLGPLGPDHPIYHGGVQLSSHYIFRRKADSSSTGEVEPNSSPPEPAAEDEASSNADERPDEPEDECPRR